MASSSLVKCLEVQGTSSISFLSPFHGPQLSQSSSEVPEDEQDMALLSTSSIHFCIGFFRFHDKQKPLFQSETLFLFFRYNARIQPRPLPSCRRSVDQVNDLKHNYPSGKEAVLGAELMKEEATCERHHASECIVSRPDVYLRHDGAPSREDPKNRQFRNWAISGPSVNSSETQDMAILKPRASRMPYRALEPPPDRYSIDMRNTDRSSLERLISWSNLSNSTASQAIGITFKR
ncbi:hypothetical protein C8J56DRAFT_1087525 [Mycena floridula]|nr:hypothetical protein C8J56DRAFT_1087525 [Mycena floridula]